MSREKLPEAPKQYDKADQDRTRRLIERALSQPAAAGTIEVTQISPTLTQTIIEAGKLVRTVAARTTGSIANGDTETGVIDILTPSNQLILLEVDTPCWLRFYATEEASDNDATRLRSVDPLAGLGVIGEFIITADLVDVVMRVAPVLTLYSGAVPVDTLIYYAVTNDSGSSAEITFNMTIIELETATE